MILWGVVGSGVLVSVILGSIWYGPLFGKKWMSLMGVDPNDSKRMEEGKKNMWKMYGIQMVSSAVTIAVLTIVVQNFDAILPKEIIGISLLVWIGFVVPTEVGAVLWSGKSFKNMREILLINIGYGFVLFFLLGCILVRVI